VSSTILGTERGLVENGVGTYLALKERFWVHLSQEITLSGTPNPLHSVKVIAQFRKVTLKNTRGSSSSIMAM